MDNMELFRQQMFQNAAIHGGASGGEKPMMTPETMKSQAVVDKNNEVLEGILKAAEERGEIDRKDDMFQCLAVFFMSKANTPDGKERALGMAISAAKRLNANFTFTKR